MKNRIVWFTATLLFFVSANSYAQLDSRQIIYLSADQKEAILIEMRSFLEANSEILQGALNDNMQQVEEAARPMGLAALRSVPDELKKVLPAGFMEMGPKTHQSFQSIADDARDLGDSTQVLEQLSQTMKLCVSCHRAYRLVEKPSLR